MHTAAMSEIPRPATQLDAGGRRAFPAQAHTLSCVLQLPSHPQYIQSHPSQKKDQALNPSEPHICLAGKGQVTAKGKHGSSTETARAASQGQLLQPLWSKRSFCPLTTVQRCF